MSWSANVHHRRAVAEMWGEYAQHLLTHAGSTIGIYHAAREAARAAAALLDRSGGVTSPSPLLLGLCSCCGAPIVRHRLGRRQMSCADVRRLDEALKASGQPPVQPRREFEVIAGGRDRDRQIVVGHREWSVR